MSRKRQRPNKAIAATARTTRFWPVKWDVMGTFHKASKEYLPLYVAKFCSRYNNRENDDIFGEAIRRC
jgi:hypothetical protein